MNYQVNDILDAGALRTLFLEYKNCLEFDVKCRNRTIDGFSVLGLISMVGNTVQVTAIGEDENKIQKFYDQLERYCR